MSEEQMNYEENMEADVEEFDDDAFEDIPKEEVEVEEDDPVDVTEEMPEPEMEVVEPPKKKRGRPRKDASATTETKAEPVSGTNDETAEPPKKRRGRPRKDASAVATQVKEVVKDEAPKRRGRPRKSEQVETQVETAKRPVRTGGKMATTFSLTSGKETKSVDDYVAMVEATYAGNIKTLDINLDIDAQRIVAKINETIELSFPV